MSRRSLFILLFVSVALNLFIVGAVAGAWMLSGHLPGRGGEPPRGGLPTLLAAGAVLPRHEADAYRDALSAQAVAVRPKGREARIARHDAWLKLGADPLDSAGILSELDRARALQAQAQGEVDRKILDFAAHLPAADRAKLGEALSQPPPGRGGRRRRGPEQP